MKKLLFVFMLIPVIIQAQEFTVNDTVFVDCKMTGNQLFGCVVEVKFDSAFFTNLGTVKKDNLFTIPVISDNKEMSNGNFFMTGTNKINYDGILFTSTLQAKKTGLTTLEIGQALAYKAYDVPVDSLLLVNPFNAININDILPPLEVVKIQLIIH